MSADTSRHFVLAAGGTGGHMIPAHALAQELRARGHRVALITDARGAAFPGLFQDVQVHVLPAGRFTKNPTSWPGAIRAVLQGREMARRLFETFRPEAVVGFGGYPAFPAMLAAFHDKLPTKMLVPTAGAGVRCGGVSGAGRSAGRRCPRPPPRSGHPRRRCRHRRGCR